MYRLLEKNEIMCYGDEIYSPNDDISWSEIAINYIGDNFDSDIYHPVRRKIQTEKCTCQPVKISEVVIVLAISEKCTQHKKYLGTK